MLDTRATRHNPEIVHHIPTLTYPPAVAAAMAAAAAAAAATLLLMSGPVRELSFNT